MVDAQMVESLSRMPRYFFDIKDGSRGYRGLSGMEFITDDAARERSHRVAAELLKNQERRARHWRIAGRDEGGRNVIEVPLIAHDRTLTHNRHSSEREWRSSACGAAL